MYIYSIRFRNLNYDQKIFEGTKYFGSYSGKNGEEIFEIFDDQSLSIYSTDDGTYITIEGQKIDTKFSISHGLITAKPRSNFDIKLIAGIGRSWTYELLKYTPEACRQIIKNYEKEKGLDR